MDLPTSMTVHTNNVAREQLPVHQPHRRRPRQPTGVSTAWTGLASHGWRSLASSHLGLPHERWRHPRPVPASSPSQGSQWRRKPVTPARAAGITQHAWMLQERLSYRVPAWFLDSRQAI